MKRVPPWHHCVITGGSSGLGLEIARQLVPQGVAVTLVARNEPRLAGAAAGLRHQTPGANVRTLVLDVVDAAATRTAFEKLAAKAGAIDTLINSAGILVEGHAEQLTIEDYRAVMDVNLFGTVNACTAALATFGDSPGTIVNVSSVAGLIGVFGYTAYGSSKHAIVGYTRSLAYELEPRGVRVVLVCPGEFDSPMVDALDTRRTPENREHTLTIPKLSVEQVAAETISGIAAGRRMIIPGRRTRAAVLANRLLPRLSDAVARRRIARVYMGSERSAP
ncbi:hypothetical protein ASD37_20125 [Mycobacterium sp. Root135]|uniref:SDR family NAD(P)-dependent oxidoreductase n=1 Tax=Mycobacterium sp. Root135 TaxID=1736457 RepID=UPI0006FDA6BB|nr:SDR family NAD(P)-dependent oxidoreductase [Mycobacterium sp. Root135]KQY04262.1 hypothetical protein ASD37_20125 [Mycobacterium sp. Root135]